MSSIITQKFQNESISQDMVIAAAKLFSANYGVWGPQASEKMGSFAKPGSRVRMSATKLTEQILPPTGENIYIRALSTSNNNELVGNVFATRWESEGRQMVWVTQLCVDLKYRNQGIAKRLLEALRTNEQGVGILSSHPFAILAVFRVFARGPDDVDLEMAKFHAREIMNSCPVEYVKRASLCGSLWGTGNDGTVSCADTQFWVDHEEPLEALSKIKEKGVVWPLGHLPGGHEFLILVKAKDEKRQRTNNETS